MPPRTARLRALARRSGRTSAALSRARASWTACACLLLVALACQASDPPARPSLLLITLDTTRADYVSLLGGPTGATPHLDAFGAEAAVFETAWSESNMTNPSHLSIMTGLPTREHGVSSNFTAMPPNLDTLAKALQREGYETAAFVSARPLAAPFGWAGFDTIPDVQGELDASEVTDRAVRWLGDGAQEPFFAWVHYWNPHTMYEPPPEDFARFYTGDPTQGPGPQIASEPFFQQATDFGIGAQLARWLGAVRDPAWGRAKYTAELHYTDRQVGRLLAALNSRGLAEDTVIVIAADHGESLGEHGIFYAHVGVYDEVLRVPLMIYAPGQMPVRSAVPVWTLDIAPTVAELLGAPLEHEPAGLSLVSALRGEPDATLLARDRFIHHHGADRAIAIRDGRWKMIWPLGSGDRVLGSAVELFDIEEDPSEQNDLSAVHPEVLDRLRATIQPWLDDAARQAAPSRRVTPEIREQLEAMGYVE